MKIKTIGLLAGILVANTSSAAIVGGLGIVRTGCNADANTCIVVLDTAIGPAACNSFQVTWNGTTSAGKNAYATMLTASVADRPVRINFDDNSCNGPNPALLTVIIE